MVVLYRSTRGSFKYGTIPAPRRLRLHTLVNLREVILNVQKHATGLSAIAFSKEAWKLCLVVENGQITIHVSLFSLAPDGTHDLEMHLNALATALGMSPELKHVYTVGSYFFMRLFQINIGANPDEAISLLACILKFVFDVDSNEELAYDLHLILNKDGARQSLITCLG